MKSVANVASSCRSGPVASARIAGPSPALARFRSKPRSQSPQNPLAVIVGPEFEHIVAQLRSRQCRQIFTQRAVLFSIQTSHYCTVGFSRRQRLDRRYTRRLHAPSHRLSALSQGWLRPLRARHHRYGCESVVLLWTLRAPVGSHSAARDARRRISRASQTAHPSVWPQATPGRLTHSLMSVAPSSWSGSVRSRSSSGLPCGRWRRSRSIRTRRPKPRSVTTLRILEPTASTNQLRGSLITPREPSRLDRSQIWSGGMSSSQGAGWR